MRSEIASPAASSAAVAIRKPDESRAKLPWSRLLIAARFRCAVSAATLVLTRSPMDRGFLGEKVTQGEMDRRVRSSVSLTAASSSPARESKPPAPGPAGPDARFLVQRRARRCARRGANGSPAVRQGRERPSSLLKKCFERDSDPAAADQGGRPELKPSGFIEDRPTPSRRRRARKRAE